LGKDFSTPLCDRATVPTTLSVASSTAKKNFSPTP